MNWSSIAQEQSLAEARGMTRSVSKIPPVEVLTVKHHDESIGTNSSVLLPHQRRRVPSTCHVPCTPRQGWSEQTVKLLQVLSTYGAIVIRISESGLIVFMNTLMTQSPRMIQLESERQTTARATEGPAWSRVQRGNSTSDRTNTHSGWPSARNVREILS